ncbi:hypothetical protein MSAN_01811100 [Mycena sanguinolenta]|uniref:Uncharacterized protein n=1 Tax=Mycena sanguinolenta TaxID=230812 RepID=A0A8H6XRK3_9AGAR|nr:hypothetical protein MSAN_01811100 [Mycena sanguinolenta]
MFIGFPTLRWNDLGIILGDTNIRPPDIVKHLSDHDDLSVDTAIGLLDPLDKQNVPRAVTLIQRFNSLEGLPACTNPTDVKMHKAILKWISLSRFSLSQHMCFWQQHFSYDTAQVA